MTASNHINVRLLKLIELVFNVQVIGSNLALDQNHNPSYNGWSNGEVLQSDETESKDYAQNFFRGKMY